MPIDMTDILTELRNDPPVGRSPLLTGPLPATFIVPAEDLAELLADRERLDQLGRYLQMGGTSVSTVADNQSPRDGVPEDDQWNHAYTIGHEIETENRGCYRFFTMGKSRSFRTAIDLAMKRWAEHCAAYAED